MGTNYYLKRDICPTCKHSKERYHIGKSSMGWTFTFRGYTSQWDDLHVKSATDWRNELQDGTIIDEYNREITDVEFWEMVEKKRPAKLHSGPNDWIDAEGNSFSSSEFS